MGLTRLPRRVLRAEYELLRMPVSLAGQQFPAADPRRLAVERLLGQADELAGRWLGDAALQQRGRTLRAHADTALRAEELDEKAAQQRRAAEQERRRDEDQLARRRQSAVQEEKRAVLAARRKEQSAKRAAASRADAHLAKEKARIDAAADSSVARVQAVKRARTTAVQQRAEKAMAKPRRQMVDAAEASTEAADRKKRADRLGTLAKREKQSRRS